VEQTLSDLRAGRAARLPCYSFKTHCRMPEENVLAPRPVVIVDGLWLLRRPALRRFFDVKIFVDCPARMRRGRRLARDLRSRGRTRASILKQLQNTVEPMHDRFVAPQRQWADFVLGHNFGARELRQLTDQLREKLQARRSTSAEDAQ
jgi:uridine kinase